MGTKELPARGPPVKNQRATITAATSSIETVAENTGGVAIVNRNDFETVVPRILRENGSYYLLGYESPNLKADGRLRTINVKVNRPGVTVRARSGYYGATAETPKKVAADPNALSPELQTAVGTLVPSAAVRMQVSAAAFAVPGKPTAGVAISVGVRPEALQDLTQADDVDLVAAAFTVDGTLAASWQQPARMGAGWTQYELLTRLDLKPGRYQLRVSAHSKLRGKAGSVFTDIEVPDFSKPLSLSGVVVHAEPALTAPPNPDVAALVPIAPTTLRDFAGNQQVTTFLRDLSGRQREARGRAALGAHSRCARCRGVRGTANPDRRSLRRDARGGISSGAADREAGAGAVPAHHRRDVEEGHGAARREISGALRCERHVR